MLLFNKVYFRILEVFIVSGIHLNSKELSLISENPSESAIEHSIAIMSNSGMRMNYWVFI